MGWKEEFADHTPKESHTSAIFCAITTQKDCLVCNLKDGKNELLRNSTCKDSMTEFTRGEHMIEITCNDSMAKVTLKKGMKFEDVWKCYAVKCRHQVTPLMYQLNVVSSHPRSFVRL